MEPYHDSIEHLSDELRRLDLMLRRALLIARHEADDRDEVSDAWRGLVISEVEIDQLQGSTSLIDEPWRRAAACLSELIPIDERLAVLRQRIDERRAASEEHGVPLALSWLAARFALSAAEIDVLLVALAPELETAYDTAYAYLHNDVTRKRPSVDLALGLICHTAREKLDARTLFAAEGPLRGQRLITLGREGHDADPSFLRQVLKVEEAVVRFLLDQPSMLAGELVAPSTANAPWVLADGTKEQLGNLVRLLEDDSGSLAIRLVGDVEAAGRDAAMALAERLGKRLLWCELAEAAAPSRCTELRRDAILGDALLVVVPSHTAPPEAERAQFWQALAAGDEPVLLLGPATSFAPMPAAVRVLRLELELPSYAIREEAWRLRLNGHGDVIDVARLADSFVFGGQRIVQTLELGRGLAALRQPSTEPLSQASTADLLSAGRTLGRPNVSRFAARLEPRYTWSDIVLPDRRLEQLQALADRRRFRRLVHESWGFGAKLARGKGLNVLFTGPSGTGKTMAAEILAGELALDLYQIDLSSVVSKYIGETEKHLSAIFSEAEHSPTLLFFDEADALFGKRTEVKDAHDRYANIEVNYLLQRLEQYEGVVVLATNLQRNLDDAFLRRMQEVIEFPFPDEALRERIWRAHLPAAAPRAEDIDFTFLGRQFKLSGGNIKNVVVNAAYLAAKDSEPIAMAHFVRAVKAEFLKQGKLCTKSDFGSYYDGLQADA